MRPMARSLAAIGLAAGMLGAAAQPAAALTPTTIELNGAAPTVYGEVETGATVNMQGQLTPRHAEGTTIRVQRYEAGAWHTVTTVTTLHGAVWHWITPKQTVNGFKAYRVCVSKTSRFAAACSPTRHFAVGHMHYLSELTPTASSGGYFTGTLVVGGLVRAHALLWPDSSSGGSVSFSLHKQCSDGFLGIGVGDSAGDVGHVTFTLYADGVVLNTQTIANGPYYNATSALRGVDVVTLSAAAASVDALGGSYGFGDVKAFCTF